MDRGGRTPRDEDRLARIRQALASNGWDTFVCTLPSNVLLLTGYWPVIGSAVAIATREGAVAALVPEDEEGLALQGWADVVRTFRAGSLEVMASVLDSVRGPLAILLTSHGFQHATVACEHGGSFEPASYASRFVYGASLEHLLTSALPRASLTDATPCLARLRAVLTSREVTQVRAACGIARSAFELTAARLQPGMRESEVAAVLRSHLSAPAGEHRTDGFAWCMSGPNAARAYAAYQQTRSRRIEPADCVLLHCNSFYDGFWTDITRTFWLHPSEEDRATAEAVLTAASQAHAAIRPGAQASAVDRAAREVMTSRGLGEAFKHATGHGVGFAAIDHNAIPRIHPRSDDLLETGMIFNVEPAAYFQGRGGIRHCDMAVVTQNGAEVLTPFQNTIDDLVLR